MYKYLFRTVFSVIGVIGLMTGVTGAEYSQVINITGTNGNVIQSFEQKRDDLELYSISSTGSISHYTIMDRNMGATEVFNGDFDSYNTGSFGYQYQYGNNYGFEHCYEEGCDTFTNNAGFISTVPKSTRSLYMPSKYASNIRANSGNWMAGANNDNIWGGAGDTWDSNGLGTKIDRRGPCPDGYYIPSTYDFRVFKENFFGDLLALLLPPTGYRSYNSYKVVSPNWSYSRLSTPRYQNSDYFSISKFGVVNFRRIEVVSNSYGIPIRCFKNIKNTQDLHIYLNGGGSTVLVFTGNVGVGRITTLGTPYRDSYIFGGRYSTSNFITGTEIFKGDIVPNNLYAKWNCIDGYEENEENTGCLAKIYTITYNLNGGINNENNVGEYTIETPTIVLQDASKEGYIFGGWYSDPGFTTKIKKITEGNIGNKTLYAKWECDFGYVENESKTACEKIRVDFYANGGQFNFNSGIYSIQSIHNGGIIEKEKSSPNLDEGEYKWWQSGETVCSSCAPNSGNNGLGVLEIHGYSTGFIQIDGAEYLNVYIKYGGSSYTNISSNIGPIGIWTGEHTDYEPRNPNHSDSAVWYTSEFPAYGAFETDEFVVGGDSISIVQSSGYPNYGWYVTVIKNDVEVGYESGAFDNIPEPTREGHKFVGWYLSGDTEFNTGNVSTGEVTYVYAKWECAQGYVNKQGQCVKEETKPSGGSSGGGGGGGGGGGSSSSCKNLPANAVANNSSTPSSNTNYYYSTNTSKVCTFQCKSGHTRNAEKETCDKASDTQTTSGTNVKEPEANTGNNTKVETGNNTEIQTGGKIDTPEQTPQDNKQDTQDSTTKTPEGKTNSTTSSTYSPEFQEAYEFAHENGITTKNTIESADMNGKLTRIAMAKMLSQYAINILGKTPDTSNTKKFDDVSDKRDADYDNGVTLAYQLGIMGQNMANNFRPDDEVTRAEFATALSRMLYQTSDGEYKSTAKYYINHMKKLKEEGIITKDDPKMKELRGYVMIMLMRSAK